MLYKIAAASALVFSADALRVRGWSDHLKNAASSAMGSPKSDSTAKTGKTGGWADKLSKTTGVSADTITNTAASVKGAISSNDSSANTADKKTLSKDQLCEYAAKSNSLLKSAKVEKSVKKYCGKAPMTAAEEETAVKNLKTAIGGADGSGLDTLQVFMSGDKNGEGGDVGHAMKDTMPKLGRGGGPRYGHHYFVPPVDCKDYEQIVYAVPVPWKGKPGWMRQCSEGHGGACRQIQEGGSFHQGDGVNGEYVHGWCN